MYFITGRVPTGRKDRTFYVLDTSDGVVDQMLESDLIEMLENGLVELSNAYSYGYVLHGLEIDLQGYLPKKGETEFYTLVGMVVDKSSKSIMGYSIANYYGKVSCVDIKKLMNLIGRKRVKNALHVRHIEDLEDMYSLLQVYYTSVVNTVEVVPMQYRVNSSFKIDRLYCKLSIQLAELDKSTNMCTFIPSLSESFVTLWLDCSNLKEAITKSVWSLRGIDFKLVETNIKHTPSGIRPTSNVPIFDDSGNSYTVVNRVPFLAKGHIPSLRLVSRMKFRDGKVYDVESQSSSEYIFSAGDKILFEDGSRLYYESKEGFMEYDFQTRVKVCLYEKDYRGGFFVKDGDLVVRIRSWEEGKYDPEGHFSMGAYSISKRQVIGENRDITSNFKGIENGVVEMRYTYSTESVFENIYKIIGVGK